MGGQIPKQQKRKVKGLQDTAPAIQKTGIDSIRSYVIFQSQ